MPLEFMPTQPEEATAVAQFLITAFHAPPDAPFAGKELLEWKYFSPRGDWSRPRSYVLKQDGRIVAHACVHPVTFLVPGGEISSMKIVDWAGSPGVPGAGLLLLRQLAALADTQMSFAGSEQMQQILPKAGFRLQGSLDVFGKVVRPWGQFRTQPVRNWKTPARLVRNTLWSRSKAADAGPWSSKPASGADGLITAVRAGDCVPALRSAEMLDFIRRCPAAAISLHALLEAGEPRGFFVLSRAGGQTRIADFCLDSDNPADWLAAFSAASRAAAADPLTCETVAVASIALARHAILGNGFRLRRRDPIFLYDPKGLVPEALPLGLSLLDGDEFYLNDPSYPYLT